MNSYVCTYWRGGGGGAVLPNLWSVPLGEPRCWPLFEPYMKYTSWRDLFININQLDALNFIILFQASTCFEHM